MEGGDDFVAAGHDGFYFVLDEIAFGFLGKFIGVERLEFSEELTIAFDEVFRGAQFFVLVEGAAEIDAPDRPILADQES